MSSPDITESERAAVLEVLDSKQLSLGPRMKSFEEAVAEYAGAEHAIAVSSGTAGLHLCVVCAGWGENDLVITSPFSFVASAKCPSLRTLHPRIRRRRRENGEPRCRTGGGGGGRSSKRGGRGGEVVAAQQNAGRAKTPCGAAAGSRLRAGGGHGVAQRHGRGLRPDGRRGCV